MCRGRGLQNRLRARSSPVCDNEEYTKEAEAAALKVDHDMRLRQLNMLKACTSKQCNVLMSLGMVSALK